MKIKDLWEIEYLLNCANNFDPMEELNIELKYAELDSDKKTGCSFVFQSNQDGKFNWNVDREKLKVLEKKLFVRQYSIGTIGTHLGTFYIELFEKVE